MMKLVDPILNNFLRAISIMLMFVTVLINDEFTSGSIDKAKSKELWT